MSLKSAAVAIAGTLFHFASWGAWSANYVGAEPISSYQGLGQLQIHLQFVESFVPAPNTAVPRSAVQSIAVYVPGAPAFPQPWDISNVYFELNLDASGAPVSWWLAGQQFLGAYPNIDNQQFATYMNGSDGEASWDFAGVIRYPNNNFTPDWSGLTGAAGEWVLAVPESSTSVLAIAGLAVVGAAVTRRRLVQATQGC